MNKDLIQLSSDFALPVKNLLSQKLGFMGSNGSGKTYGVMKILEEILQRNGWVIVFDPVGIHYGLRLDKSGKKPSDLTIPIFGGLHGDVPLTPESGKLVADLLFEKRLSAVLDVSQFTDSELNLFAANFAEQFYRRMQTRKHPVSIVLEECQEFIPQNPQKGEEKKLHHFTRMGKLGRNYGIGLMMISPRPQEVNKKILNLTQLMFAFQMGGPHERKAMGEWFDYVGFEERIDRILPTLEVGCPYVSSPRWLKFNGVIKKINQKKTFDTSSTPDFDDDQAAKLELSPIDIAAIQESMQAVIEQSKADDPKLLRQEIERLKKDLRKRPDPDTLEVKWETKIERVEVPVLPKEQYDAIMKSLNDIGTYARDIRIVADDIESYPLKIEEILGTLKNAVDKYSNGHLHTFRESVKAASHIGVDRALGKDKTVKAFIGESAVTAAKRALEKPEKAERTPGNSDITGPMQRSIDAIAWLESSGMAKPNRSIVALLAGYSPLSTSFTKAIGKLRIAGLCDYPNSESVTLTDSGLESAGLQAGQLSTDQLHRLLFKKLSGPQRRTLKVLIDNYPDSLNRDLLAEQAGYSPLSTSFTKALGRLRTFGLIDYPSSSEAVALSVLFLE